MRGMRGMRGDAGDAEDAVAFWKNALRFAPSQEQSSCALAKTFLKDFCWRKGGSVNKVLTVNNKTAYFNEKNRRTASPPTVFVVFEDLFAEMKTDCHGSTVKKKC